MEDTLKIMLKLFKSLPGVNGPTLTVRDQNGNIQVEKVSQILNHTNDQNDYVYYEITRNEHHVKFSVDPKREEIEELVVGSIWSVEINNKRE